MINKLEIDLISKSLSFWDKLTEYEKNLIISDCKVVHFNKGNNIYYGGNECIGVIIVKNGTIRTSITSEEGKEITLYRIESKDVCILSATCVLETIDFDVSISAETDCDIIQISSTVFSYIYLKNIYVELFSYKLATERFSEVMWTMQQILFKSIDKRLATFLIEEVKKTNSLDIKITHEQIAVNLGSAREVISRMLKYFSEEGYVKLSRGVIHVTDKKALMSIL